MLCLNIFSLRTFSYLVPLLSFNELDYTVGEDERTFNVPLVLSNPISKGDIYVNFYDCTPTKYPNIAESKSFLTLYVAKYTEVAKYIRYSILMH